MSRPRYSWWSYAKSMIRRYPERVGKPLTGTAAAEQAAVQAAIDATSALASGAERLRIIDAVMWSRSYQIAGAAMLIPVSEQTAKRWHGDFIQLVGRNFKCDSLTR